MTQRYFGLALGPTTSILLSALGLIALTLLSGGATFYGQIVITKHWSDYVVEQNEMLIVALKELASGQIPVPGGCETNGTDAGVFVVDGHEIVVGPMVNTTVHGFETTLMNVFVDGNVTAAGFTKGHTLPPTDCCPFIAPDAICVWDNSTTASCPVAGALVASVIPALDACQINLAPDQIIATAILTHSPDDAAKTLNIAHDTVVFDHDLYVNGTHRLPSALSDKLLSFNNSRGFTGFDLFPCGLPDLGGNNCNATGTGTFPYDLTMVSWYTGRVSQTVDSETIQGDQRSASTKCAGGYPISPNPYLASSNQAITEETYHDIPISQLAYDILRCGNVGDDVPVSAGDTPQQVFDPSRTWATTPVFPLSKGAVYKVEFGTELINFYMSRDDDDTGLDTPTKGCSHYFASALDDDDCLPTGDVRSNYDYASPDNPANHKGRKNDCDAHSRGENLGPVAVQLYALCLGVGVAGTLYESVQGLVMDMFVTLHHINPVVLDMSSGPKTHKMRGHSYVVIDDQVFDAFPGYFGQCAVFSAATPFYMDRNLTELYPHLHSEREEEKGTTFARPLNTTYGGDRFFGYNHFCRVDNVVPANTFIEVHSVVPGIDIPASVLASSSASGGSFSLRRRGERLVEGAYADVGKMSAAYWKQFVDPDTGSVDWTRRAEAIRAPPRKFVSPREKLKAYRKRILKDNP